MSVFDLDVYVETEEHSIDMKSGLEMLNGVSELTLIAAETILKGSVPKKKSYKSNIRTTLKESFKGSYGHAFGLDIFDEELKSKFQEIGRDVFAELIRYFIKEALYQRTDDLSVKAQKIVNNLDDEAETLIKKLRVSCLKNSHSISEKFKLPVKLRYRKDAFNVPTLSLFNEESFKSLDTIKSNKQVEIVACITRLNINTGNGRLQIKGENETIAFGFGTEYRAVRFEAKKKFSENLDYNNGLDEKERKNLVICSTTITLRDGKVVKYIVRNYRDE